MNSEWGVGIMFSFWPLDSLGFVNCRLGVCISVDLTFLKKMPDRIALSQGISSKELEES